jgi:PAS domain S-box-containing protein
MALHKHRVERQLDEHRTWLAAVLETIPDSVIVTDLVGQVQFLNEAAEHLIGAPQAAVLGQGIDEVIALTNGNEERIALKLLDKAEWGNRVSLPRDTLLSLRLGGNRVPVEGDVVISYHNAEPTGAIFTLRDISRREQEEGIERQEERMMALGRLTSHIAHDFSSLHSLLDVTCRDLSALAESLEGESRSTLLDKTDTIARVNAIALLMTEQLTSLSAKPTVRATLVSASGVVASVEPLLNKMRGVTMQVDTHLTDESTLVLCHPDRLSILLVNVFLNARERMGGSGRIRISTSQITGHRVSIVLELEHIGTPTFHSLPFPLEMESPDFSLSIAQALVAAMEGSITFSSLSDNQGRIEILLPLQHAAQDLASTADHRGSVLLIGADLALIGKIEAWLESVQFGVMRFASAPEALLLGQLYDNRIDCVIVEAEAVATPQRRKVKAFFGNINPAAQFIRLISEPQLEENGWQSVLASRPDSVIAYLRRALDVTDRKIKASP